VLLEFVPQSGGFWTKPLKYITLLRRIIVDLRIIVVICIPDYLSMTHRCRPHERPASSGQTSLVAATSQSVRFARSSLHATTQDSRIYIHVFVCSSEWAGNACTLVAGTQGIAKRGISWRWLHSDDGWCGCLPDTCIAFPAQCR
jgi:hypothetical protein